VDSRRITHLVAATSAVLLVAAGCGGGDGDDPSIPQSGERETTTTEATTTTASAGATDGEALQILVTNDDGVGAEGIDTLVTALTAVDGVEVTVVAPAAEQSGTGGNATEGPLTTTSAQTASGYESTAVEGFPADSIRVAFEDLGIEPDLVVSGINEGQNLGPIVDISGTVGAARAALRLGVPALAVSQGMGDTFDYETAAGLVVDWLAENREAIVAGELPSSASSTSPCRAATRASCAAPSTSTRPPEATWSGCPTASRPARPTPTTSPPSPTASPPTPSCRSSPWPDIGGPRPRVPPASTFRRPARRDLAVRDAGNDMAPPVRVIAR
jgi:5'-nucleotidase